MALPTASLTYNADASVSTNVWKFWQAGTPFHNTNGIDADNIEIWDDIQGGSNTWIYQTTSANGPTYKVTTPLMALPCLAFNGSTEFLSLFNNAGTVLSDFSTIFGAGAKTAIFSIYVAGVATNAAGAYDNDAILADGGGLFGIHLRDAGSGVYKVIAYNWDGNEDKVEATISLNTPYVITVRHDGTSLYLGINGAAETSTLSGNTTSLTGATRIGANYLLAHFYNGRIGEMATWNTALTGSDLTDANAYFTAKWLPSAATFAKPNVRARQAVKRAAYI